MDLLPTRNFERIKGLNMNIITYEAIGCFANVVCVLDFSIMKMSRLFWDASHAMLIMLASPLYVTSLTLLCIPFLYQFTITHHTSTSWSKHI